ncbi:MAG TPA: hypothetical protein VG501_07505 [Rhizomicrobium sp.]|nr:hypothetical protein [Rhizomicrobium sp.]
MLPAAAQSVPRIKASVVAFDGAILTVKPDGEKDAMKIGLRPATRIMKEEEKALAEIPAGAFIGATGTRTPLGVLNAQEVHLFPETLHGSGEGFYPATPNSSHFVLDGTVTAVSGTTLHVKFRGAGSESGACMGRAPADPLTGCQGQAAIAVAAGTPVLALVDADKSLIKPGTVVAISIMAGPDGKPVTPGLTIETVATPPVPLPVPETSNSKSFSQRVKKPAKP